MDLALTEIHQPYQCWILLPIGGCGLATWLVTAYILWTNIKKMHTIHQQPSQA